jgi:tRNA-specific 2-thiouridylase
MTDTHKPSFAYVQDKNTHHTKRVFVGLSGGVDSGVSAALLREQGYDVVGVFIKIWQPEFIECTWREDRLDAIRIASALGIPFREIDLSEEYKRYVVDAMVRDYERGVTPNPDVLCNEKIKFGAFAQWAWTEGADLIATGHYARIQMSAGELQLLRGTDNTKDQSYFLCRLDAHDLARTIFPIGDMLKSQVRERARAFGLPVANKPDSQGLCFVGDVSLRDFLARYITLARGDVLDMHGNVIGEHEGAALYTIGQRHGFTTKTKQSDSSVCYYVISISVKNNTITVSSDRTRAYVREIGVTDMHWIIKPPRLPLKTTAQSRYRETPVPITITKSPDGIRAIFDEPHLVSSGQSLVLYNDDQVLGSGIILRTDA